MDLSLRSAVETLKKAIEIDPNFHFPRTHFCLVDVYEQRSQYAMAPEFEKAVNLSRGSLYYERSLGHAYGASGKCYQARRVLQKLYTPVASQYVSLTALDSSISGLVDNGPSLPLAEHDGRRIDRSEWCFLRSDPELTSLYSDPHSHNCRRS